MIASKNLSIRYGFIEVSEKIHSNFRIKIPCITLSYTLLLFLKALISKYSQLKFPAMFNFKGYPSAY